MDQEFLTFSEGGLSPKAVEGRSSEKDELSLIDFSFTPPMPQNSRWNLGVQFISYNILNWRQKQAEDKYKILDCEFERRSLLNQSERFFYGVNY
ncbi:MAG: hypothetical protein AAGF83_10050 [Cyanobacteria bacterium P01_G01_bin.67]